MVGHFFPAASGSFGRRAQTEPLGVGCVLSAQAVMELTLASVEQGVGTGLVEEENRMCQ